MNRDLHAYYLATMGIQLWASRTKQASTSRTTCHAALDALRIEVSQCQRCALSKSRTQPVFGVGDFDAELIIIGEAPGFHEDQQGKPFVGRAGQLLDQMLMAIGLKRESIFIANVLKCRPPQNRDPLPNEIIECTPYLERQVTLIQPKLIVALGRFAAHYLLKSSESLSRLRQEDHEFGEMKTPVIVSYHPAYLLRNPSDKRKAYRDWLKIADRLGLS